MSLPVNIKTPKLNKENLVRVLRSYPEVEDMKNTDAVGAVAMIKEFTILRMKTKLMTEGITIDDFFDNPGKVKGILDSFVEYAETPDAKTKYASRSRKIPLNGLLKEFISIRSSFLREKEDDIVNMLREVGFM